MTRTVSRTAGACRWQSLGMHDRADASHAAGRGISCCRKRRFQGIIDRRRSLRSVCYPKDGHAWRGEVGFPPPGAQELEMRRPLADRVAVSRDHVPDEFAEIDPELARGRTVDDAKPNATIALNAHDLRVGERSIERHSGPYACRWTSTRPYPALPASCCHLCCPRPLPLSAR